MSKYRITKTAITKGKFQLLETKEAEYRNEIKARRENPGAVIEKIPEKRLPKNEFLTIINYDLETGVLDNIEFGKLDGLQVETLMNTEELKAKLAGLSATVYVFNLKLNRQLIEANFPITKRLIGKDCSVYLLDSGSIEFRDTVNLIPMTPGEISENLQINDRFQALRTLLLSLRVDGNLKLTIASTGLTDLKERMGGAKVFDKYFPGLSIDEDQFIRKAFKGGMLACNTSKGGHGYAFDINSSFSYSMKSKMMPYGNPVYFTGRYPDEKSYPLFVQRVVVDCKIKDGYIPCVMLEDKSYLEDTLIPEEVTLTNVDLEILNRYYEIYSIQYIDGYMFPGAYGFFDNFVDFHYNQKKHAENKLDRLKAKLLLNTPYGKIGANPTHIDGEGSITKGKPGRVDVSAFIASYSREHVLELIQEASIRGIFKYADTDSVHMECETVPDFVKPYLDDYELGFFKIEEEFSDGIYIGPKCYAEKLIDKDQWKLKASGLNKEVAESFAAYDGFEKALQSGILLNNYYYNLQDGVLTRNYVNYTIGGIL